MLFAVIAIGSINKGAQRWLSLGVLRFQPSEIMKLVVPMMLAWYLRNKVFPLRAKDMFICCMIIAFPVLIIAKQPDLGTALLVTATGLFVLLLAGFTWKLMVGIVTLTTIAIPVIWHFMHSYQKARLFTFLSPERDPYGSGYNIIQSKSQSVRRILWQGLATWITSAFAIFARAFNRFYFCCMRRGVWVHCCILLLGVFLYIVGRGLYISIHAQDTFSRLLAGSLVLSFFTSFFVNIGMVIGFCQ